MSILLDGTNDALTNTGTPPVTAPPFTLACWLKLSATGTNDALIAIGQSGSADHYHRIYLNTTGALLCTTRDTTSSNSTTAGTVADTTTWHLAVGVWAATNSRTAYLDGVAATTNTGPRAITTPAAMRVGESMSLADDFAGRIAHMAAWNVALTQGNIDSLYAGALPTSVQSGNLVWYVDALTNENPMQDAIGSYDLTFVEDAAYDADNPTLASTAAAPTLFQTRSAMRWI